MLKTALISSVLAAIGPGCLAADAGTFDTTTWVKFSSFKRRRYEPAAGFLAEGSPVAGGA